MNKLLSQAIADIRAGNRREAFDRLRTVIQQDPTPKEAEVSWLCLAHLVTDPVKKRACYQKVLSLNPENKYARRGLFRLDAFEQLNIHAETVPPQPASNFSQSESSVGPDANQRVVNPTDKSEIASVKRTTSLIAKAESVAVQDETTTPSSNVFPEGGLSIESVIALPVFGAIAGATLGAGEILLYAIDILINSGDDWLLSLFLILIAATIGAPIVIIVGIILAIIGGIGGFIGSIPIALVCLIIYGLLGLTQPTRHFRGIAVFIITVAGFVALTEYGLNQQIINGAVPLDISKLPLINNVAGGIVGIILGASLFTVDNMNSDDDKANAQVLQKKIAAEGSINVVGGVWQGYRKLGKGLMEMHEDYLEDKRREAERTRWRI